MKKRKFKWLALLMMAAMVSTLMPTTVFAGDTGTEAEMILDDEDTEGESTDIEKSVDINTSSRPPVNAMLLSAAPVTNSDEKLQSVYVNGSTGSDANSGEDSSNAVQTLEHALQLVDEGGTIYICGEVRVASELSVNGVSIARGDGYTGQLLSVTGSNAELTLENTTINGRNLDCTYYGYLVFISDGATLNIEAGSELINNHASAVYVNVNSNLYMNGGAIKNNVVTDTSFGGGGICNCGNTIINGGEISGNSTSIWGGGILSERGSVILNGGTISGNKAAQGAGLAVVGSSATLSGALITNNTADYYGGGVYVQGSLNDTATFTMSSGTISGNGSGYTGAGIFSYYYDADTVIRISGGTIQDNTASEMGNAVAITGYNGSLAYPRLELSGEPDINGDIFYQNDYNDNNDYGYVIYVTGTFNPAKSIELNRSNNVFEIPAVEYVDGLTPSREHFHSGNMSEGLVVADNQLVWADAGYVYFYDEDETEFSENRHGVVLGETIDLSNVPVPVKTGYTLMGWYEAGASEPWDFESDVVSGSFTKLYARWSLNAPSVTVTADTVNPHVGESAVLTANVGHDLNGLSYTYQWSKDGLILDGETANQLKVSEAGNYTVKVRASDGTKLSDEAESDAMQISIEDHIFGEWTEVKAPTCTEKGSMERICDICGVTETKDVEPTGHTWEENYTIDKMPTCTEDGNRSIHCKNCDAVKDSEVITATGHKPADEWKSDASGHWRECTICGDKVDFAEHTSDSGVITTKATATKSGVKTYTCTVCGRVVKTESIAATGVSGGGNNTSGKTEAVATYDPNFVLPYAVACVLAGGVLIVVLTYKRRHQN